MIISRIRETMCWLVAALLVSIPAICLSQADVDVGGSEADDGAYAEPYGDQFDERQHGYDSGYDAYGDYGGGMDDGMPIVYAGDGMRVVIEQVDETGSYAAGTVTIGNQQPMRFEVEMQLGQNGTMSQGQVQTTSGFRPFRAWDQNEEVTIAEFEGRRYRLVYQENYQGSPPDTMSRNGATDQRNEMNRGTNAAREEPKPMVPPEKRIESSGPRTIELVAHKLGATHTLLAPRGWKVEGGAWEPPMQAYSWMPSRHIAVTAPDGTSVRFKPNFSAIYQQTTMVQPAQPGSLNEPTGLLNMPMPDNPADWARWIEQESIRAFYADATDIRVSVRVEAELTDKLRRLYARDTQFIASMQAADYRMQAEQNAMTARSSYQTGGKRWQQIDAFNQLATMAQIASAFGGADHLVGWDLRDAISLRAPADTLDSQMPVLLAVVNSLRQTPEYSRQLLELQTRISKGNHEAAMRTIETYRQISQASYNAHQEVNAGIMNSYQQRNASQDRGQANFVNYIHDQQDYVDPAVNGNVTLPASYDQVYSNGKGEYVLTNDASFEPGADWSVLQRRR